MESVFQALIAILFCFFLVYILSDIKKSLLRSLNTHGDAVLSITVRAEGDGKGISKTLKAAEILQQESRMAAEIVIIDCGMNMAAKSTAESFVRRNSFARMGQITGEDIWNRPSTPE